MNEKQAFQRSVQEAIRTIAMVKHPSHVFPAPSLIQSLSCSRPCQNKVWVDLLTSLQQNQNHITPQALDVCYGFICKTTDGQK